MPLISVDSVRDAEIEINLLHKQLEEYLKPNKNVNFKGKRIINAGASEGLFDYIVRQELYVLSKTIDEKLQDLQQQLEHVRARVSELE
jgi:hypothetical protein